MKKITLFVSLLISAMGFSQDYRGIYVENTTYDGSKSYPLSFLRNVVETELTNSTGTEGTNHKRLDIATSGTTDTYMMAQYEISPVVDLSAFSNGYYNISLKTNYPDAFLIRFQSGANRIAATLNATTGTYGLATDGQWHTLSIPFSEFASIGGTGAAGAFSAVGMPLVFRSSTDPNLTAGYYIEFDGVFLSKTAVLSVESMRKEGISMYPNPASNEVSFSALNSIDSIVIHNLLGQKVLEVSPKSTNANVNISSLSKGAYVVTLTTEGKSLTQKLLKK